MNDNRPFYELPLSYPKSDNQEVQVRRDIAYLEEDDPVARMDIYLPPGDASQGGHRPLLFLHGGPLPPPGEERPWPKEWRVFQDYGRLAAANGLAGVVINHRYTGYEGLVQAMSDVQQAQQFLEQQGARFGVNGDKLAVWAVSGAGMLLSALLRQEMNTPACLVALYPMLDLTHIPQAADVYSDDQLMALSPLSHIETIPNTLPMFLARAGLDLPGLNRALDTFVKQALYHNLDLELRNLPQAAHGCDMFDDAPAVQESIKRGLDFALYQLAADR